MAEGLIASPDKAKFDPSITKFEETESSPSGQRPGEDPAKLRAHLEDSLAKAASTVPVSLQVKSGPRKGEVLVIGSDGWGIVGPFEPTKFLLVPYYTDHYVVVASGLWKGYYLSFNSNSYVGAYKNWSDARYWAVEPLDCSAWPGLYAYQRIPDPMKVTYLCVNGVKDGKFSELLEFFSIP